MKAVITAPTDLEEGYPLEIELDGQQPRFVRVPQRVRAGEKFWVEIDDAIAREAQMSGPLPTFKDQVQQRPTSNRQVRDQQQPTRDRPAFQNPVNEQQPIACLNSSDVRAAKLPIAQECNPLPIVEADTVTGVHLEPSQPAVTAPTAPKISGKFSTGLCDCINICCSGMWWNGYFCQCILWGQLATRLKLNLCGDRGRGDGSHCKTCGWIVGLWAAMWVFAVIFLIFGLPYCRTEYKTEFGVVGYYERKCEALVPALGVIAVIVSVAVGIFILVFRIKTRNFFRRHYSIPGSCCEGDGCCDDCCCVYFCSCCSVIQMLRHTHDELQYKYQCCNNTGLPPDAPEYV